MSKDKNTKKSIEKENKAKSKKTLYIVLAAVALLVAVGIILAVMLIGNGEEEPDVPVVPPLERDTFLYEDFEFRKTDSGELELVGHSKISYVSPKGWLWRDSRKWHPLRTSGILRARNEG